MGEQIRDKLKKLKLNDKGVWKREEARGSDPERIRPPLLIKAAYLGLCWMLDVVFANRPIQRFWFLETVARMPYFSYISMLHLYESLGWWRAGAELRKVSLSITFPPTLEVLCTLLMYIVVPALRHTLLFLHPLFQNSPFLFSLMMLPLARHNSSSRGFHLYL